MGNMKIKESDNTITRDTPFLHHYIDIIWYILLITFGIRQTYVYELA